MEVNADSGADWAPVSLESVQGHSRSPVGPALLVVVAAIRQEVGAAWLWALLALLGVALLKSAGVRVGTA